jgi:hypothetical protein
MKFPLRIVPFRCSIRHEISAYIIQDADGRSININCEVDPLRRDVAKLWTTEEAQALAKRIARFLTDEHETEVGIRLRQQEMLDPRSAEYRFNIGKR